MTETGHKKILVISIISGILFLFILNTYSVVQKNSGNLRVIQNASQASVKYIPLSGTEIFSAEKPNITEFVQKLFKWLIAIAIILAILYVVLGSVQYMMSDAVFQKSDAKAKIQSAIGGLILALVSWLILYTINPAIVSLNIFGQSDQNTQSTSPANNSGSGGTSSGGVPGSGIAP